MEGWNVGFKRISIILVRVSFLPNIPLFHHSTIPQCLGKKIIIIDLCVELIGTSPTFT